MFRCLSNPLLSLWKNINCSPAGGLWVIIYPSSQQFSQTPTTPFHHFIKLACHLTNICIFIKRKTQERGIPSFVLYTPLIQCNLPLISLFSCKHFNAYSLIMEGSLRGLLPNPLPPHEQWMLWLNAAGSFSLCSSFRASPKCVIFSKR